MSEIQRGGFVDLEKIEGNLRIVLNECGRRVFAEIEAVRNRFGIDAALRTLLEDHLQTGWEEVRPEEIAALTSALPVSDEAERDEEGRLTKIGRIFWNPAYQVQDEIEELRECGEVFFEGIE